MFQTASERVEAEGLAALNSLTACLSRSVLRADAEDLLDSFLSNILQGNGAWQLERGMHTTEGNSSRPVTFQDQPPRSVICVLEPCFELKDIYVITASPGAQPPASVTCRGTGRHSAYSPGL